MTNDAHHAATVPNTRLCTEAGRENTSGKVMALGSDREVAILEQWLMESTKSLGSSRDMRSDVTRTSSCCVYKRAKIVKQIDMVYR